MASASQWVCRLEAARIGIGRRSADLREVLLSRAFHGIAGQEPDPRAILSYSIGPRGAAGSTRLSTASAMEEDLDAFFR